MRLRVERRRRQGSRRTFLPFCEESVERQGLAAAIGKADLGDEVVPRTPRGPDVRFDDDHQRLRSFAASISSLVMARPAREPL
jgi:hypothetical protein